MVTKHILCDISVISAPIDFSFDMGLAHAMAHTILNPLGAIAAAAATALYRNFVNFEFRFHP